MRLSESRGQTRLHYAEREHFRQSQRSMVKNAIKRVQSQACLNYAGHLKQREQLSLLRLPSRAK